MFFLFLLQIRQEKPYYIADPEVDSLVREKNQQTFYSLTILIRIKNFIMIGFFIWKRM